MSAESSKVDNPQATQEVGGNNSNENENTEEIDVNMNRKDQKECLMVQIGNKLGSGSFGELHFAKLSTSDEMLAIKLEKKRSSEPKLKQEYEIYRILGPAYGVPKIIQYGSCGEHYSLLMQLLGHSLNYFHRQCDFNFSLKTTALLALQILDRIEFVHSKGVIYRDVKPENFVFGNVDTNTLYIIDFGLSELYIDPETKTHIPYSNGCNVVGTARYMSLNTHYGRQQSRRDDLESIGYLLMYFQRGTLPWQNLPVIPQDKCKVIGIKKEDTTIDELCTGYPEEYSTFLKYSRKLKFDEQPDYEYLRTLFRNVLENNNFEEDYVYDWDTTSNNESKSISEE